MSDKAKTILLWILTFSAGLFVGMFIMIITFLPALEKETSKAYVVEEETTEQFRQLSLEKEVFHAEQEETTTEEFSEVKTAEQTTSKIQTFELTAYCPCEICCGEYAKNRPVDENGKPIVYGSTGERLTSGYSIAVDPSVIPYGTEVIIDGRIYKAQDCGGAIQGNRIDVYFDNHQEALRFGRQTKGVEIIESTITD
jgi:3D (Asp-Asp-Asp) domain-containing protein